MSKVVDFYKAVEGNPELKEELLALNEKYKERIEEGNIQATIEEDIITIAGKHDYVLTKEDFAAMQNEEIGEKELEAVAGGAMVCIIFGAPCHGSTGGCLAVGFGVGDQDATLCVILGT